MKLSLDSCSSSSSTSEKSHKINDSVSGHGGQNILFLIEVTCKSLIWNRFVKD